MKRTKLALVNLTPESRAPVLAAAKKAFSDAELREMSAAEAAGTAGAPGAPDLMVLVNPDEGLVACATQAVDAAGSPRWGVVILGNGSSDVAETVPPEEWNPQSLARVFRAAVQQRDLMRENCRMRGDLKTVARRISHDLRTPVSCIYTTSNLLGELPVGKGPALANVAEIFRQSSWEISQIVDRVSFVLKASADPVPQSKVGMGTVVAAAIRQLGADIRNAGATVSEPDSWPEVNGVGAWLQVVWWNLIHNALQHGGPGVQVKLSWEKQNGACRFEVSDAGPGVLAVRQAGLFAHFDQLYASQSKGLGLTIVQRLVELHGGTCGYEKQPGGSARFYFTLP